MGFIHSLKRRTSKKKKVIFKLIKKKLLFIIITLLPLFSKAQSNLFYWENGLDYCTGRFDSKKFTTKDLELIYRYLYQMDIDMFIVGNVWQIEQMDTATTTALDTYYSKTLNILDSIKRPPGQFWDSLLVYRKKELHDVYTLKRLSILALKTPALLKKQFANDCFDEVTALNGTEQELLEAWRKQKERLKQENSSPEEVEEKWQKRYDSPNRLKYARLDLMDDWWNCMNQFVFYYKNDIQLELEFRKLFISVKVESGE